MGVAAVVRETAPGPRATGARRPGSARMVGGAGRGRRIPRRGTRPSPARTRRNAEVLDPDAPAPPGPLMPRYIPEDSLESPRFTGPSTFARLPFVPTSPTSTSRSSACRSTRASRSASADGSGRTRCVPRVCCCGPTTRTSRSRRSRSCPASTSATSRSCPGYHRARATPRSRPPWRRSSRQASSRCSSAATTPARCRTCGRPGRAGRSPSSTSTRTPTPGTATSGRSTTTGRGCGGRSRRGSSTSTTRSRSGSAARSTRRATGRACGRSSAWST